MERSTKLWVGVVVLAALGGAVYFKAKEDQNIGTSRTTSADLPDLKVSDDIDKISITNADKGEVVLVRKGDAKDGKWELSAPLVAAANQTNVKSLVDNLKELKAKEEISAAPSEEQKKEFQFEPSKAVHVVVYKGADKKLDVTFGKSGARGQMAMVGGKPGIYGVTGYSGYVFARETKGWRDTEVFKFDDANVSQITIEKKEGTLSFTKGERWAGTFKDKAIADFEEEKVKQLLSTFKGLSAEDFGDGKSSAETGLDSPEAKITITLKDNAGKYVLKIGKNSTGTSRWAQKEGEGPVIVVPQYTADMVVLAEPSKFQKPKDAGADSGKGGMPSMPPGMPGLPHGMPPGMGDPHGH
jgi:hypothetical protein